FVGLGVREMRKDSEPKPRNFNLKWFIQKAVLPAILIITLISGGYFTYTGYSIREGILQEPTYSLSNYTTGAAVGWDPFNASVNPQVEIGIQPFISDTATSALIINLNGGGSINGTFTFGFVSPFI